MFAIECKMITYTQDIVEFLSEDIVKRSDMSEFKYDPHKSSENIHNFTFDIFRSL